MFYWIYDLQTTTLVALFCLFFVGVTWLGIIFVRPVLRAFVGRQPGLNDLVGYLLGAHGVYLGVLLGLLALASYQNFSDVEGIVVSEATKLSALYRDVSTYPEPYKSKLTGILRAYTEYVIKEAWPLQQKGLIPTKGTLIVNEFQKELVKFEPQTKSQEIVHAEAFSQLNSFIEARRLRLHSVTTGIPAILWAVVLIGGAVQIFLLWLLEMKLVPHCLLSGVIAFYLATLIALIAAMDNPFRGEVSVTPDAFQLVLDTVMIPDAPTSGTGNAADSILKPDAGLAPRTVTPEGGEAKKEGLPDVLKKLEKSVPPLPSAPGAAPKLL